MAWLQWSLVLLIGTALTAAPPRTQPKPPEVGTGFKPEFQRGVCFSHNHSFEHGYGSDEARRSLETLKALGATHVSLHPIGYSFNVHHTEILGYKGEDLTLTSDRLRRTIRDAHAVGLKVVLNPHLWIGIHWGQGDWRGLVAEAKIFERQHAARL